MTQSISLTLPPTIGEAETHALQHHSSFATGSLSTSLIMEGGIWIHCKYHHNNNNSTQNNNSNNNNTYYYYYYLLYIFLNAFSKKSLLKQLEGSMTATITTNSVMTSSQVKQDALVMVVVLL